MQLDIPTQGQCPQGLLELGAGEGKLSQELCWESRQLHSASSPLCLEPIVGCVGRASYWEEGIASLWKAKGSLV